MPNDRLLTWLLARLDPKRFALARHAEALVDTYFRGLQTTPPRGAAVKRARARLS